MKPLRSQRYLEHVRRGPCALCGGGPCEAHHVKARGTVTMGRKGSDFMTAPLCRECHRAVHDHPLTEVQRTLLAERALVILVGWVEERTR